MSKITFQEAIELPTAAPVLMQFGLMNADRSLNEEKIMKTSTEQKELFALAILHWGETVIADYVQLTPPPGRSMPGSRPEDKLFDKTKVYEVKMPKAVIQMSHFLKVNQDYKNNGRYYFLLEKETEQFQKDLKEDIERRQQQSEDEANAKEALSSGLSQLVKDAKKKKTSKKAAE